MKTTIKSMYLRNRNHKLHINIGEEACTLPTDSICVRIIVAPYNATYYYYLCKDIIYRKHYSKVVDHEFIFIMEIV